NGNKRKSRRLRVSFPDIVETSCSTLIQSPFDWGRPKLLSPGVKTLWLLRVSSSHPRATRRQLKELALAYPEKDNWSATRAPSMSAHEWVPFTRAKTLESASDQARVR